MPVLLFARHALWLACGITGAAVLSGAVALIAYLCRETRRDRRRDDALIPTDAEFDAGLRDLLDTGGAP